MDAFRNARGHGTAEPSFAARHHILINFSVPGQTVPATVYATIFSDSTSSKTEKLVEIFKFLIKNIIPVTTSLLLSLLHDKTNLSSVPVLWIFLTSLFVYSTLHILAIIYPHRRNGCLFYGAASASAAIALFAFLAFFMPTRFSFIPAAALSIAVIVAANWDNWNLLRRDSTGETEADSDIEAPPPPPSLQTV